VPAVELSISRLTRGAEADDLATALTGISGVAGVRVDLAARTVRVEYDPHYVNPRMIADSLKGAGYPVDAVREVDQ
jgi:copper chaperone CopZ